MRFSFVHTHGSGNDFPLIDARGIALDDTQWARVARALADRSGDVGGDGLLLLTHSDHSHIFGMRMFNPDGSEAETCLNGLRCTARLGFALTGTREGRVRLKQSDAGARIVADIAPGVATIETRAGPVSLVPSEVGLTTGQTTPFVDMPIPGLPSARAFTAVAMPNPHLVTFVEAVDEDELVRLGDWCEAAPALIPARANVSFVELREVGHAPALFVRTYERGVGLTDSCGSAMAASTHAAARTGRIGWGVETSVFNAGGMVCARADADGMVTIAGNATVTWEGAIEVDPDTGIAGPLTITRQHDDEVAAWSAMLAGL
ncbi:diaminopimelate epimerase [Sphingomonas sp. Leaf25]|uniref:diaminopimelate epimerase n=1 Tax=Sphingomonas sp. Leaf25 TaxID=1735692 RepID=UPI0006FE6731|nr:diaminopimelate epimerase [Sphingomonas sp. Leaf25]KQM96658.1 diaminopimelate epimerase [Sphingomonas sp. Leaf25]